MIKKILRVSYWLLLILSRGLWSCSLLRQATLIRWQLACSTFTTATGGQSESGATVLKRFSNQFYFGFRNYWESKRIRHCLIPRNRMGSVKEQIRKLCVICGPWSYLNRELRSDGVFWCQQFGGS
jgi:hypothetical protein